jgi:hypothetical protein
MSDESKSRPGTEMAASEADGEPGDKPWPWSGPLNYGERMALMLNLVAPIPKPGDRGPMPALVAEGFRLSELSAQERLRAAREGSLVLPERDRELLESSERFLLELDEEKRQEQADRGEFIAEQITHIRPLERPYDKEREDLGRRLLAAAEAFSWTTDGKTAMAALAGQESFRTALGASGFEIQGIKKLFRRARLEVVWPGALRGWREDNAATLAARIVLARAVEKEERLAGVPEAEGRLVATVGEKLRKARAAMGAPPTGAELEAVDEAAGVLAVAAKHIAYLEGLGGGWGELAEGLRGKERERLAGWRSQGDLPGVPSGSPPWGRWADSVYFARCLATVVWESELRPRLAREQAKPPALARVVHAPVMRMLSRTAQLERDGEQQVLRLEGDGHVRIRPAALEAETIASLVNRGIGLFRTVAAHKVVRWQVFTGHQQALDGNPDPRLVRIEGGYQALAEAVGMDGRKGAEEVRAIIEAEDACELPLPPDGRYVRLLIRDVTPAAPGRKSVLKLVLGTALLPDYVEELRGLGKGLEGRIARRLVPILELPPFAGKRRNEHGAQATLSMAVVSYMRDHARQLLKDGGVRIDLPTWAELAHQAGVPRSTLGAVIDRWTQDGTDAPSFLKRIDGDRYTLGDAHTPAREFLEDGARSELNGRAAGRKSVLKRGNKLRRLAGRRRDR